MIKSKLLAVAVLMGSSIGVAQAVPYTWTDSHNPSDERINGGDDYTYSHDIRDGADGFRPGIDSVTSATLKIWLYDDGGDDEEYAAFQFDGNWHYWYEVDGDSSPLSDQDLFPFTSQLSGLLSDGLLNVTVYSGGGDFKFNKSELTVSGNRAVPEPATLALMSLGLLGVGFGVRRKQSC